MADTETEATPAASNCTFFRKSGGKNRNRNNVRKRKDSDNSDDNDETSAVVFREKKTSSHNPMRQKTGIKRQKEDIGCNDSDGEDDFNVKYKSTKSGKTTGPEDMGATATVEIETALDRDAQAIFERSKEINKELKGKAEDNIYRGQSGYTQYVEKKDTVLANASSGLVRKGPVRAPANLRRTIRWV